MDLYYTLRALADYVYSVRSAIYSIAVKVNGVYLLGQYLYAPMSTVSAYIGFIGSRIAEAADDWLRFRAEVMSKIGGNSALSLLINYVDDILSIVRDPAYFIRSGIRQYFPTLYNLNNNATSTIIDALTRATGLTYSFIMNPAAFISSQVNAALGDLLALRNSPRNYIIEKLSQYAPDLRIFLQDPRGWLRQEVQNINPDLYNFLRDPDGYIIEKTISGAERLLSAYWQRIAKIAENILNRLF